MYLLAKLYIFLKAHLFNIYHQRCIFIFFFQLHPVWRGVECEHDELPPGSPPPPREVHPSQILRAVHGPGSQSFILSSIHLCIYLFIPSFIHSFTHLFIPSFIHSPIYLFLNSLLYSFLNSLLYSILHSSLYSFIH